MYRVLLIFFRIVSTFLILAGVLFKIQHWPYATTMIFVGLAALIVRFLLPILFKPAPKTDNLPDILDHNFDEED